MAKLSLPSIPFDKIAALTKKQRIAIFAGTFFILGGGFFYFYYMPNSDKIAMLKQNYGDLQNKVAKAKAAVRDLDKYEKKYKEAQGRFRLALQLLPDKKEIPALLEGISKSGRSSGLEFLLFKPDKEVTKEFYAEIPVKIEVTGGYHNLAIFFDKVARLSRIVNISKLTINSAKAEGTLKASCVATTYQFVETPKEEQAKGKSKKRKKGKRR
jgi:type IV pilus assembly protein PilO